MKIVFSLFLSTVSIAAAKEYFKETFSDDKWTERWIHSSWKDDMGKFELTSGDSWTVDAEIEKGIQTSQDAKFYAISSKLDKPFSNKDDDLVVQFSVRNVDKPSSFCGGGYIKLLPADFDQTKFGGDSPYHIMFGPDICGYDVSRIHLIFNYDGENLIKTEDIKLEYSDKNDKTHLYTMVVKKDNTYEVYFDHSLKASGNLHEQWDFPQKMIPDPSDKKPEDWVDEDKIDDPDDVKPDGWDDIPEKIADPEAKKPDDWDEEEDGEWEAPEISNPEYKGEWKPKRIDNPAYKGPWIQKKIKNENYVEDVYFYKDIGAVGFELWIVNKGSIFDNIFVGNSLEEAEAFAKENFDKINEKQDEVKKQHEDEKEKKEDEVEEDDAADDEEPKEEL